MKGATQLIASPAISTRDEAKNDTEKPTKRGAGTPGKLSNKDQRELDGLPGRIELLEAEQAALRKELSDEDLYARDPARANSLYQRDATLDEELLAALTRWEELSGK